MNHYTFNTGHSRVSPRSEVSDETLEFMRQFVEHGDHYLPDQFPGWSLKTTTDGDALISTLALDNKPVVTIGVVTNEYSASVVWPMLEGMYHKITELPLNRSADFAASKQPESTPWCAVVLIQPLGATSWMGDFERCLAWAWIEARSV